MAQENENARYRYGFVAESDEEPTLDKESEEEKDILDSESETEPEALKIFLKKEKKRPGKKSSWPMEVTDDLIDVVCSDEYFSKKLIFTNTKTSKNGEIYVKVIKELQKRCQARGKYTFNIVQTRNKFKKCVSECKKAALTCKSASGIARFQEDRAFGKWFNQLLPIVKSRESCQPEQALEPSSVQPSDQYDDEEDEDDLDDPKTEEARSTPSPLGSTSSSSSSGLSTKKRPFVPIKGKSGNKKQKLEDLIKMTSDAINGVTEQLQKDTMGPMLKFLEKENERAREHELRLFSMMFNGQAQQSFQAQVPQPQQQQFNQNYNQNMQHAYFNPRRNDSQPFIVQDNLFANNHNFTQSQPHEDSDLYQL